MSARNIALIVAALLITVGTGLVARSWINSQRPPVVVATPLPAPVGTQVLVAATDIPTGTLLKPAQLRWQGWPTENLPESFLVQPEIGAMIDGKPAPDLIQSLAGSVVRQGISAGEPILKGRILNPGDRGFLAAVLRPGYRAMAIRVNATSGIAGLVFPGDRVDLILTHAITRGKSVRRASETVLTNVRVLAIDQTISDEKGEPRVFKNATLELNPKQIEMLAVLNEMGRISLSLRSLAKDDAELARMINSSTPLVEPDPTRGLTYTWDSEVSRLLGRRSVSRHAVVKVVRGKEIQVVRVPKR